MIILLYSRTYCSFKTERKHTKIQAIPSQTSQTG